MNCGIGALNGVGLTIKARDDGGYSNPRAALSNVTIVASVFTNNETAIRLGETGKTNAGPLDVTIAYSSLVGSHEYELLNEMVADVLATNVWWGTTNAPEVEDAVYHEADAPVKGLVTYDPIHPGFAVGVTVSGCGTVKQWPIFERYGPGMRVNLAAEPCEDWLFAGWSNAIVGRAAATNFIPMQDMPIDALFVPYVPPPFTLFIR